jgi:hypothetical protein
MVDKTSTRKEAVPAMGLKIVVLSTIDSPTLTGGADTLTMTLADFGIRNVLVVKGFVHTTDNSVITADAGTCAVAGGVLTYTTEAANDNKKRVVVVHGES